VAALSMNGLTAHLLGSVAKIIIDERRRNFGRVGTVNLFKH